MVSGNPFLEPVAVWCKLLGFKLVRGATGENGIKALGVLIDEVIKNQGSALLAVDGPAGPGFKVKPGCVLMAQKTKLPIIPMAYKSKRGFKINSRWDKRYMVTPFDEIELSIGEPIWIKEEENLENSLQLVQNKLNEL